jgi:hypothetical protein
MILRILALNKTDFNLFLGILKESQGGLLRQFSTPIDNIVRYLIYEDIKLLKYFPFKESGF